MGSTLGCSIVDTRPRTEMRSPVGNRVVILQGNHQNKQHCSAAAEIDALPRTLTLVFVPGAWMVSSYPTVVTGACPSLDVGQVFLGVARCPSG